MSDARAEVRKSKLRKRLDEAERVIAGGIVAFQHTRDYVHEEMLPAIEGWSWFDWTERANAFLAEGEPK